MKNDLEKHDTTEPDSYVPAPGRPGAGPTWGSGAKTAVGTALSLQSRVWFTIAEGVLSEVFFPDVDRANLRGFRFLVAGDGFFSDERHDAAHTVRSNSSSVPAYLVETRCKKARYHLQKEVLTDPSRDALLLNVVFKPAPDRETLRLFLTANPHVGDRGSQNKAWVGKYKGNPFLFAERNGLALAIAASAPFAGMTCGFAGKSDGLSDIRSHKRITRFYTEAAKGNIAMTAELDWPSCEGHFQVAIGFGGHPAEAAQQARAALLQPFSFVRDKYVNGWETALADYTDYSTSKDQQVDHYRTSIAVLRTHESKRFPGGFVASLSVPWGF